MSSHPTQPPAADAVGEAGASPLPYDHAPMSPENRSSVCFVGLTTPEDAAAGDRDQPGIQGIQTKSPQLSIHLLPRQLVFHVVTASIFFLVFSWGAYMGFPVKEYIGVASSKIEDEVDFYNQVSGFIIAFIEVLIGLYMENFLSVYLVYLHNALWFLHGTGTSSKISNRVRGVLMFTFPVLLMLLLGNSLRSFQASSSSDGFDSTMLADDLKFNQPTIERVKITAKLNETAIRRSNGAVGVRTLGLGVLKTGVEGKISPFKILTNSSCSRNSSKDNYDLSINARDFSTTNVVFGFRPSEWNSEALDVQLPTSAEAFISYNKPDTLSSKTSVNMSLAYELFASGKIVLDRSIAESGVAFDCEDFAKNPDQADIPGKVLKKEKCRSKYLTLRRIGGALSNSRLQNPQKFIELVDQGLHASTGTDLKTTSVAIKSFQLSEDITMDTLEVAAEMAVQAHENRNNSFLDPETGVFSYGKYSSEFCGASNCIFVDTSNSFQIPRGVVVLGSPQCSFLPESIRWRPDLQGYYPENCHIQDKSLVAVGISTVITGQEYGSHLEGTIDPYITKPRRTLRLTVTKLSWKTKDLTKSFDTKIACARRKGECEGLSFKLRSGRFVFAASDVLPHLQTVSLENPQPLVQLNDASLFLGASNFMIEAKPERIAMDNYTFTSLKWKKDGLSGDSCSQIVDSYLRYIEKNGFFFDREFATVYRSAFFYLFSNGSVTQLNETIALNYFNGTKVQNFKDSLLFNSLKGDIQIRKIQVLVPGTNFYVAVAACIFLVVVALVVVVFPTRRVEFFPFNTPVAQQYIRMMNDEAYADMVHDKTLLFPVSNETLPMEDFVVEEMTLVHRTQPDQEIPLEQTA